MSEPTPCVEANGARIPLVGLGTWELKGRACSRIVEQALRLGYRHIDTAQPLAHLALVLVHLRGSGVRRSEVFVTTKIWPSYFSPPELERATKECLVRLRVSEVDLLLLHWPNPQVPLAETLGALCKVKRAGLARHIGVSNFTVALLEEANRLTTEPLVCNQVEMHPFLDQSRVRAACERYGMAVVAYSPIARGNVRGEPVLGAIARTHGKSPAQICLRFLVQQGVPVIPRTSKVERLSENLDVFGFALSPAEMAQIAALASAGGRIVDYAYSGTPKWD
jgi:2,5-diketo-D-gluconate reductase B